MKERKKGGREGGVEREKEEKEKAKRRKRSIMKEGDSK